MRLCVSTCVVLTRCDCSRSWCLAGTRVKTLSDIPLAIAKRVDPDAEIDPSIPRVVLGEGDCIAIQVAVPLTEEEVAGLTQA